MKQQVIISNFQTVIENLTPESQIYLLNMANMAKVAEMGKEKQLAKRSNPLNPVELSRHK